MVLFLRSIALFALLYFVLRFLLRVAREPDAADDPAPPRPKLIPMERTPFGVLGLEDDASEFEIEAAYRRLLKENSPDKVAEMGPEIRELAVRRTHDIRHAYLRLKGRAEE